ncbi:MAG: hypothetical protein HQL68_10130 [Magnetococcales bacterium]|nr:hypothetical protein [Magnetococcales bacterium]
MRCLNLRSAKFGNDNAAPLISTQTHSVGSSVLFAIQVAPSGPVSKTYA